MSCIILHEVGKRRWRNLLVYWCSPPLSMHSKSFSVVLKPIILRISTEILTSSTWKNNRSEIPMIESWWFYVYSRHNYVNTAVQEAEPSNRVSGRKFSNTKGIKTGRVLNTPNAPLFVLTSRYISSRLFSHMDFIDGLKGPLIVRNGNTVNVDTETFFLNYQLIGPM